MTNETDAVIQALATLQKHGYIVLPPHSRWSGVEVQVFETFDDMSKSAQRTFFEHFSADDWSYLVISESREAAMARAKELHPHACDMQFTEIDNETWVVTYHS